ncbi:methyltransferase domain-containing protein [Streptomyces demainii]|uniref:Protein-L-isoaspartate O-methyltransferase n=1 Tax=Streptomyces demainii TaxID=588122 RepID=A0ABT9KNL8_9ACTN|nr:methyltransferase domain-containing protein [Streptomyces demainii]MDP9610031.1 protein-L-isoaspartate O-methyltransferase [Streptomyces demainii]
MGSTGGGTRSAPDAAERVARRQGTGRRAGPADPYAQEAAAVRTGLVREIVAGGGLTDPAWRAAFEEVPRHLFVPYYFETEETGETGEAGETGGAGETSAAGEADTDGRAVGDGGADTDGRAVGDGGAGDDGRADEPGGASATGEGGGARGTVGCTRLWRDDPHPLRRARWLAGAYADVPLATRVRDGELITSSSQPSLMARMLQALRVRDGDRVLEIGAGTGYNAALLAHRLGEAHVTTLDLDPEITEAARNHLAAAGFRPAVVTGDGARGCPLHAPYDRIIATCAVASVPPAWLGQCRPDALILTPLATGLITLRVADARHAEGRFLATPAYFVPLRGSGPPPERVPTCGLPSRPLLDDSFRFLLNLAAGHLEPVEALALWEHEGRPGRERYGVTVRGERQWAWLDEPEGAYGWPLGPPDRLQSFV